MPLSARAYIAAMLLAGAVIGMILPQYQEFFTQIPPMIVLLGVGLVIDITILLLAMRGVASPLDMQNRLIGFAGGFILIMIIQNMHGVKI